MKKTVSIYEKSKNSVSVQGHRFIDTYRKDGSLEETVSHHHEDRSLARFKKRRP